MRRPVSPFYPPSKAQYVPPPTTSYFNGGGVTFAPQPNVGNGGGGGGGGSGNGVQQQQQQHSFHPPHTSATTAPAPAPAPNAADRPNPPRASLISVSSLTNAVANAASAASSASSRGGGTLFSRAPTHNHSSIFPSEAPITTATILNPPYPAFAVPGMGGGGGGRAPAQLPTATPMEMPSSATATAAAAAPPAPPTAVAAPGPSKTTVDLSRYWVETPSNLAKGAPQVYFYNLATKQVSWGRPEGNVEIIQQAALQGLAAETGSKGV